MIDLPFRRVVTNPANDFAVRVVLACRFEGLAHFSERPPRESYEGDFMRCRKIFHCGCKVPGWLDPSRAGASGTVTSRGPSLKVLQAIAKSRGRPAERSDMATADAPLDA